MNQKMKIANIVVSSLLVAGSKRFEYFSPSILCMPTYISLLRGINVSGHKKINMKALTAFYEEAGFKNVQTYIQSGNVVFVAAKKNTDLIEKQIEKLIEENTGFEVPVMVLRPEEMKEAIAKNPFSKHKDFEAGKMYLGFLKKEADEELIGKINTIEFESDCFTIDGKIIYLFVPGGYGKTKLDNNFFEKKLKVIATFRNWNTVNKLLEMSSK